ncbi:MAG: thiamine phosphate synthase [Nitrospiraceae bacterium]
MPASPRSPVALKGLYVILDPEAAQGWPLLDLLKQAADGGARLFQYRAKTASALAAYQQAVPLRQAAQDCGALFLINDRCDLALAVDADGVHLGQQDLPLPMARAIMGAGKLIGLSTHNDAQVSAATRDGADYLGFGPIFPPSSKRDHEPVVGIDGLRRIRNLTALPVFAIGGITVESAGRLAAAGADGVAVIAAISQAADVTGTVRSFVASFRSPGRPVP